MRAHNNVTLEGVEVIKTLPRSLLVRVPDLDDLVIIPLSQIIEEESDSLSAGEIGTLTITKWIADQKGIDYK